jgi:CheY-like chemotaxis protein
MKLLWIEDDFLILDGLLAPLKKEGVAITTAADYNSAKEAINQAKSFDVAIVDLIIPHDHQEINEPLGLNLVELLHQNAPDLPIMVLTWDER